MFIDRDIENIKNRRVRMVLKGDKNLGLWRESLKVEGWVFFERVFDDKLYWRTDVVDRYIVISLVLIFKIFEVGEVMFFELYILFK